MQVLAGVGTLAKKPTRVDKVTTAILYEFVSVQNVPAGESERAIWSTVNIRLASEKVAETVEKLGKGAVVSFTELTPRYCKMSEDGTLNIQYDARSFRISTWGERGDEAPKAPAAAPLRGTKPRVTADDDDPFAEG